MNKQFEKMDYECRKFCLKGITLTRDFFRDFCNWISQIENSDLFKKQNLEPRLCIQEGFLENLENELKDLFSNDTEYRLNIKEIELTNFLSKFTKSYLINTKKDLRIFVYWIFERYLMYEKEKKTKEEIEEAQEGLSNLKKLLKI